MDDRFLQKLLHFFTFGDYAGRNSKGSPWLFRKDFMNTDRERSILKILVHDKKVTVKDLSTRLFTSEPSIRRDLVSLERQHLLKRIYGGPSSTTTESLRISPKPKIISGFI